jgi:UDP-N-acetylglucosamine 1-carboxyvinyltransferase
MEMLVIDGGHKLSGSIPVSGSKNSSLPILIATLLSEQQSVIKNVPDLADTRFLLELLGGFGATAHMADNQVLLDCERITSTLAHYDVVRKMRASILVLAPLLARAGHAVVSLPGGCAIGTRPVDIHLLGLKALGADIEVSEGYIHAKLKSGMFHGAEFELPLPSVGATENLIMAAVLAKGDSVLRKVAREPEIVELCEALNNAGARIKGVGSHNLEIEGVPSLSGIHHQVKPDRVEAGTFIALAAATRSTITLHDVCINDLANVMERFYHAGVRFTYDHERAHLISDMTVIAPERLQATDIETAAFPGFPTDMQAQFMAAMTLADGVSSIYERIFENRMMHVPELRRMGADIDVKNGVARVVGKATLSGAPVMATDLRASASLVIAALAAKGQSEIRRVYHIDRGYESLEKKLLGLGAVIKRCQQSL